MLTASGSHSVEIRAIVFILLNPLHAFYLWQSAYDDTQSWLKLMLCFLRNATGLFLFNQNDHQGNGSLMVINWRNKGVFPNTV